MHYIIDGYNLLFATHLCEQSLEAQREELIQEICEKSEEKNLSITVVFDAHHQQGEASFRKHDQINIIFTANANAIAPILSVIKAGNVVDNINAPISCSVIFLPSVV